MLLVILPFYRFYLFATKLLSRLYAPQKSRHHLIHPFSRRYLSHIIIIIIAGLTLAANLNAYENRLEDFGQKSIVASFITGEDLGNIEEEGPIASGKKISRYLGQTGIASRLQIPGTQAEAEISTPTTVAGGSAVVRPILSPAEEQMRQRDKIEYYTVQPGDTISEIAEKFGVSNYTIIWENNLSAYSIIQPGDKLTILPVTGIRHKVVKGETLSKIAKKYDVEGEKIIEFNKLASANDIAVGETIMIPGGAKPAAAAPAYTIRSIYQPARSTAAAPVAASGKMVWPNSCRYISQYYRWGHSGLDIACPFGSALYAADAGRVIKAQGGWNGGYGNMIIIDHGNGVKTLYGHLSVLYVQVGATVAKGQAIGAEGSTGRSTGPHLHFEVQTGGAKRNPLYYIK